MVWTTADTQNFYQWIFPWFGSINVVLSGIAIITFYMFKKRRQFPVSVLAWIAFFNFWYGMNTVLKWTPSSLAHGPETTLPIKESICRLGIFMDQFSLQGSVATNTLVSIMLYLTIVKKKVLDYESNPQYFWSFVGFLCVWETVIPMTMSLAGKPSSVTGRCAQVAEFAIWVEFFPDMLHLAVQISLLAATLIHTKRSFSRVTVDMKQKKRDHRMMFLAARLLILWASQILAVVPTDINALENAIGLPQTESLVKSVATTHTLGGIIDALVIIFMNPNIIKWFRKKILKQDNNNSGSGASKMTASRNSASGGLNQTPV